MVHIIVFDWEFSLESGLNFNEKRAFKLILAAGVDFVLDLLLA